MKSYIAQDAVFKIIPKNPEAATKCSVLSTGDGYFKVKLFTDEKLTVNEPVELFAITPQGLLYFETFTKEVSGSVIDLIYPIAHKFLQRREYTRINFSKNILIQEKDTENTIQCSVLDISAGGMKLSTQTQLSLSKDYKAKFDLDKNVALDCYFEPIRIEQDNIGGYTVSGRFKILKNIDRISLVQFCFRKQMENQNM
ncbi:MAG: PilZ domain-containing protein [Candidatus Gastranaerophilales bacterium]|nr:PilZ domain-containing protein [Candidatus Gastranaerophilales bacterium]